MANYVTRTLKPPKPKKTTKKAPESTQDERKVAAAYKDTKSEMDRVVEARKPIYEAFATPAETVDDGEKTYVPSELQGHSIRLPDPTDKPAVYVLESQTERYYSHSTIEGYWMCKASLYFRKTKAPSKVAFALERGTVAHTAIETMITTGDMEQALAVCETQYELKVTSQISKMSAKDAIKARFEYDNTSQMVREFCLENEALIQQKGRTESEVEFSVTVPMRTSQGIVRRRFFGKIDWIVWNADHTKYMIMDFKTSAQVPSDGELDLKVQFALYQYACTQIYGFPPTKMYFYYLKGKHVCIARGEKCKPCQEFGDDPEWRCAVKAHNETKKFSDSHPRPKTLDGIKECLQYQFIVENHSDEDLQQMFDTYYLPAILGIEVGLFGKDIADPSWCINMCQYKEYCDTVTQFPLPTFVKVKADP